MSTLTLEAAKVRRRRVLLFGLVVTAAGVAWSIAGAASALGAGQTANAAMLIDGYLRIMTLVMPLLAAVVTVRVAGAEIEGGILDQLDAVGVSRLRLAASKLALISGVIVLCLAAGLGAILGWGATAGIPVDAGLSLQAFAAASLPAIELAAVLLAVAMRTRGQVAVIGIGLGLAVIAQLLALIPAPLQLALPSTQLLAANPTRWVQDGEGRIAGYEADPSAAMYLPIIAGIAAIVIAISLWATRRKEDAS